MSALTSNEPIGTTARLAVLRLGAGRLSGLPRSNQMKPGTGIYAWVRSDGFGGAVNDGRPPGAATGSYTTARS